MGPKKKNNFKSKNVNRNQGKNECVEGKKQHDESYKLAEESSSKNNHPKIDKTKARVESEVAVDASTSTPVDPKYVKRPLISNWKKYEIEEEIEVEDTTSFENVLKNKYLGGAEFRFSDEKVWEESFEANADSSNDFFSLDLTDLSLSLSCLPLYQRLNVEQSYFESEMISQLENEAQIQLNSYNNHKSKPVNSEKTLQKSHREKEIPKVSQIINKERSVSQQVEPPKSSSVTVQDLPAEDISVLELELENLLNFDASKQTSEFDSDFPVVCFDD